MPPARRPVFGVDSAVQIAAAVAAAPGTALQRNADAITRGLLRALKADAIPAYRMEDAHFTVAEGAHEAIVDGWRNRLAPGSHPYRQGDNRLSGTLEPALENSGHTQETSSRAIAFLNDDLLRSEARHWYRVNYGAFGPLTTPVRTTPHPVLIGGHVVFDIQDVNQPEAASWLPRRYEISEGGTELRPVRLRGPLQNKADVRGGGRRAALFTELGYAYVARNIGFAYADMLDAWVLEEGAESVRRELHAQGVRIPVRVLTRQ